MRSRGSMKFEKGRDGDSRECYGKGLGIHFTKKSAIAEPDSRLESTFMQNQIGMEGHA